MDVVSEATSELGEHLVPVPYGRDAVEDGLEPGWWAAWDELEENGVAKGYFVA